MNSHPRVISRPVVALILTCMAILVCSSSGKCNSGTAKIAVLYDALGKTPRAQKDWGYSALIEYAGKRTLFERAEA